MFDDKAQAILGNQNLNPNLPPPPAPSLPMSEGGNDPDDIFEGVGGIRRTEDRGQRTEGEGQSRQSSVLAGIPAQPALGPPPAGSVVVPQIEADKIQTMPPEQIGRDSEKNLSGGKKVLIIGVTIVLVVALAGAGYWLYGRLSKPLGRDSGAGMLERESEELDVGGETEEVGGDIGNAGNVEETEPNVLNEETLVEPQFEEQLAGPKDTDGDGLEDEEELALGTNVNEPDSDRDGLSDKDEVEIYKTNPLNPDTDGDSYFDGDEVEHGYDPGGEGRLLQVP